MESTMAKDTPMPIDLRFHLERQRFSHLSNHDGRFAAPVATTMPSTSDLAYTLAHRRSMHSEVAAVRARTLDELMERLQV